MNWPREVVRSMYSVHRSKLADFQQYFEQNVIEFLVGNSCHKC